MPQSLAKVNVHLVFSTKNRTPWLKDADVRCQLFRYMATVLNNDADSPAIIINGVEDHIHALCRLSRKVAIMDVVKSAKTETSKWIKKQGSTWKDFSWQAGYGTFSVSESNVEQVRRYIARQEEHHQAMSFKDELRLICRRHGVEFDERYIWD